MIKVYLVENIMSVLVVEDDLSILKLMEITLRKVCNVIVAENGKKAIEKIKDIKPALIISDHMMPEMSGMELKEYLNTLNETKDIPFIFLTSLSDEKTKNQAEELGAFEFLIKPISPLIMREKVAHFLKNNIK